MSNIYDEAIEEIKSCFYDGGEFPATIKALERAKKVEELLELKNKQIRKSDEMIAYLRIEDDYNYNLTRKKCIDIMIEIKELEEMK